MIFSATLGSLALFTGFLLWLKWLAVSVILWLSQRFRERRFHLYDVHAVNNPVKLGFLYPELEKELESPCPDSHLEKASDEVFFYGVNSGGECVIARIARGGNEESEAWIYLKLKDGRTYRLMETQGYERNLGDRIFSCGGLQMQYKAPMRSWRIFFSGMLNETKDGKELEAERVFVKFAFQWKASSEVFDLTSDMKPTVVASAIARAKWKIPFLPPTNQLSETLDTYCQLGVLTGVVATDDRPDCEMYLFGEKVRYRGRSSSIVGSNFVQILGNTPENGLFFHIGEMTSPHLFHKLPFGFVMIPNRIIHPVEDVRIVAQPGEAEKGLDIAFTAGKSFEMNGIVTRDAIRFESSKGWEGRVEVKCFQFVLNEFRGSGVIINGEIFTEPKRPKQKRTLQMPKKIPLTVQFYDEISCFSEISGGKGASLGKLTHLSRADKMFVVPKGITVTTSAYKEFMNSNIMTAIRILEDVAYGNESGDVAETCKKVCAAVVESKLPAPICACIESDLKSLFGDRLEDRKFAVRSSATGEDTEQMSAAGQMDTFLGIRGLDEIYEAVKKCWASQFGYVAIEYKRRHGQELNCPMAVVVQEMADCEMAGVLFTCDPVTNNPSRITITGSYGLGESVVSGSEEPDTVVLSRGMDDALSVHSVIIGAKKQKIVMQENGGVVTEEVPEEARQECCLSNDMAIKLGKLAIQIEKHYRSPRDVEWGIRSNTIYILQSRPVTSGAAESDFEIKHEFDAPLRCEMEYHTVSNVGEVMPGATSPLGIDVTGKYFASIFRRIEMVKNPQNTFFQSLYFPSGILPFYNHFMMSVFDLITRLDNHESMSAKATMIGIFGRVLDEPEIFAVAGERTPPAERKSIWMLLLTLKDLFFASHGHEKVMRRMKESTLPECRTSKEFLYAVLGRCSDHDDALRLHVRCFDSSTTWNILLFLLLGKNKENFDTDVYSDFARLLSSASGVESADVPAAMQNLSHCITEEIGSENFKTMSAEDAVNWLYTTTSLAGYQFRQFLKRHGHRCLKEFDVHSVPWELDPKSLVKLLQNISGSCVKNCERRDDDYQKIFSELNTPLDFKTKFLLRFLIPNSRRAVRERELCKSLLIKSMDVWRRRFLALSRLMASEGRIPDKDLLFFMTIDEIVELLQTRSPSIITRAVHRRKLFPTLEKYIFPELMKGVPKPLNEDTDYSSHYESAADLTMKGVPVSRGVVRAFARVAMTLEEAAHLKPGEILITYSTDIGWSPYFPILAGVVTELGGLVSHGAVISREYGLPCVVGLQGATRSFRTGDYVLLDGNRGTLQRILKPEP